MEKQECLFSKIVKNLEMLNKKVLELLQILQRANKGYDYITASELAQMLGVSTKTVYARVHNRQIPYCKPGGKALLLKLDEIMEWVKSGQHPSLDELRQNNKLTASNPTSYIF